MSLFPLPVAPFEHYMLADDRPNYPMTPLVRLDFQGRLDRQAFPQALDSALSAHPLLRAHLHGSPGGRTTNLHWVDASHQLPFLSWKPWGTPLELPRGMQIDLSREIGIRIWVREAERRTELLLQVHHACCDGLGMMQFLETLLANYASLVTSHSLPTATAEPAPSVIRKRGQISLSWRQQASRIYQDLFRVARYYRRTPQPLAVVARHPIPSAARAEFPAFVSHHFSRSETALLCEAAKTQSVSVNALLLRDLYQGLDAWNRRRIPFSQPQRSLRIVIPVNLRAAPAVPTSAFNAVSMAFIDRDPAQIADSAALLKGLQDQMEEAKNLRHGLALMPLLRFLGAFPGGIARQVRDDRCLGSAVFSNLGVVFDRWPWCDSQGRVMAGDVVLENLVLVPPIRPLTHAAFAVATYGGRLMLGMNYAVGHLDHPHALELLGLCVESMQKSLESQAPRPTAIAG